MCMEIDKQTKTYPSEDGQKVHRGTLESEC